ncbi:hypothetical protein ACFQ08_08450, partial [Streptosporangium algeriense]
PRPAPAPPAAAGDGSGGSGGFVGGDPESLNVLSRELTAAGRKWREAGTTLATLLARLGLDPSAGREVGHAGEWIASQVKDVNRRRDELLKRPPQPEVSAGEDFGTRESLGDGGFTAPRDPDHVIDQVGDRIVEAAEKGADALGMGLLGDAVRLLDEKVSRPFTKGIVEGTVDLVGSVWEFSLIRAATDMKGFTRSVDGLKDGLLYGAQHPVEFAGAIIDWDTLTTDPLRWFGKLAPEAIITVTTAGSGAAASGASRTSKGLGRLSETGRRLRRGSRDERVSGDTEAAAEHGGPSWGDPAPPDSMGTRRAQKARHDPESLEAAPPRLPGDATLPSGDPVYYRPGSTAIGYDTTTLKNFDLVAPRPGYHDAVVHGKPEGYFSPGRMNAFGAEISAGDTHPAQIADAIRRNPHYQGEPVRLISCHSGTVAPGSHEIPAAQEVANRLGVPVLAPTDRVGINGRVRSPQVPRVDKDGYWRLFLPIAR